MSFQDDLEFAASNPAMNATSVWLDGQDEETRTIFYRWLEQGKSKAALFRACRKNGLDTISAVSTFREHCREIQEQMNG